MLGVCHLASLPGLVRTLGKRVETWRPGWQIWRGEEHRGEATLPLTEDRARSVATETTAASAMQAHGRGRAR